MMLKREWLVNCRIIWKGALAHAVVIAALQILVDLLFAAEHRSCQRNALDNLFVAGAATDVAANGVLDLLLGGLGVLGYERGTRHDHAGDAKTALHGTHGAKGVHKVICSAHPELDAYFIYSDKDGKLQTYSTEGMKKYMRN